MAKKAAKVTLQRDFTFQSDADLNTQIAAFAAAHEAAQGQRLAMDARMSLGANRVRVTFRLVDKKAARASKH